MPIIKSAIKRMRTSAKSRTRNLSVKHDFKDATKAFRAKPTFEGLRKAQSQLDIAVKKNILKTGTAARRKAQLSREAKAAGVKITAFKKKTANTLLVAKKAPAKKALSKKKPVTKAAAAKTSAKKPIKKKTPAKK